MELRQRADCVTVIGNPKLLWKLDHMKTLVKAYTLIQIFSCVCVRGGLVEAPGSVQ